MTDKKEGMSVNEAGRKGGEATSASHDKEFYQEIGSKGGQNSGGNFANDTTSLSDRELNRALIRLEPHVPALSE
jgi:general stress protein YciG